MLASERNRQGTHHGARAVHPSRALAHGRSGHVRTFVLSPSSSSNSLGRGISMATTAAELGDVELWALQDGPTWVAASKFGIEVNLFSAGQRAEMIERILSPAQGGEKVLLWVSKGLHPLDLIARAAAQHPRVTVIHDIDEDDLALITMHVRSSLRRAAQFPPTHPRSPFRVRRAQARTADAADAFSFTSHAIQEVYAARGTDGKPASRIPHVRSFRSLDEVRPEGREPSRSGLTLAFLGSIRPHKGIDHIVNVVEAMPDASVRSFHQTWRPPKSLRGRWIELPSSQSVIEAYRGVDVLLVPQDMSSHVAQTQLSAKVLDAALVACAVVGTPTRTLEEYCAGAYLPIDDWLNTDEVVRRIRSADLRDLGMRLRHVYDSHFNPAAASAQLRELLTQVH